MLYLHSLIENMHNLIVPLHACACICRKDEFVTRLPITIFCGTFNVNGKKDEEGGLGAWLQRRSTEPEPDIYAIGYAPL
jgi:hypothetical protein